MSKVIYTKERNMDLLEVREALTHLATAGCKCDIDRALDVDMVRISGSVRNVLNGLCAISTPELLNNQSEIDALRQRLADSENTVAQLRAARDKRRSNSFEAQLDTVVSKAKADALAVCDGLVKEAVKSIAVQDCASDNDGWIECRYLPINQWCDVKRADGTTDRVCRPEVRGVQQDDEITHYRPAKKEAKPKQDEGWIKWYGGECPVKAGTKVVVRYRDGLERGVFDALESDVCGRDASSDYWRHDNVRADIIAYRLA